MKYPKEIKKESKSSATAVLTTHWPKIEARVRKNANAMHMADQEKRASAEKRGEHWEVLFVNPLTKVEAEEKFLNPRATVSLDKKEKPDPFWYQVESKETRAQRMMAFVALKDTLS